MTRSSTLIPNVEEGEACPKCGEHEADPSVEAFEVFGEIMCAECAASLFDTAEDKPS